MRSDFTGLAAFLEVAERKSFTAAAASLGITRAAVSQSVQRLEQRVGTPLFVRTTRSVDLTDAGVRLAESAGPAFRLAADALDSVAPSERAVGTVKLNVPRLAVPLCIAPALSRLRKLHPELVVEVVTDDRLIDILALGFDAGIRLGYEVARDMVMVRVTRPLSFVVVGSPAYLAAHGMPKTPTDLLAHQCIGYRRARAGGLYRWELTKRGRDITVAPTSHLVTSDLDLAISAARDGLGLAYVCEQLVATDLAAKRLRLVMPDYRSHEPGLYLYFPAHARTQPKMRAVIDVLRVRE
ncbi:MAG TPA: LysR family transcriptional regulator [Kofleriaceae bacterium]|jgi:DNA-binding transcriptional LysR family regulator